MNKNLMCRIGVGKGLGEYHGNNPIPQDDNISQKKVINMQIMSINIWPLNTVDSQLFWA